MDIFLCKKITHVKTIENIVVELKRPQIKLNKKYFQQTRDYMDTIFEIEEFNAPNMSWNFYLVGNEIDDYIKREIERHKDRGEISLAFEYQNRYKLYAKTWSELFAEFECKHNFLLEKLKLQRDKFSEETTQENSKEIVKNLQNNSAIQPSKIIPINKVKQ